jgi:hypothetical protein
VGGFSFAADALILSRAAIRLTPYLDATVLLSGSASEFDCGSQISKRSPRRDRQRKHRNDVRPVPDQRTMLVTDGPDDDVPHKRMIMGFAHGLCRGSATFVPCDPCTDDFETDDSAPQDREGMRTLRAFLPSSQHETFTGRGLLHHRSKLGKIGADDLAELFDALEMARPIPRAVQKRHVRTLEPAPLRAA